MHIDSIKEGIVIDHIKAGNAMAVYQYLNLGELDCPVAIIKNVVSGKMGKKDIIKVAGRTAYREMIAKMQQYYNVFGYRKFNIKRTKV